MTGVKKMLKSRKPLKRTIKWTKIYEKENTIRDEGSTVLYAACTVDTDDTVHMVYTVDTAYTIQTALHCLNISMYAYI